MSVAFDAATKSAQFTADTTFSHTPVGTPRGVVVFIAQQTLSNDQVDSVTYGGVSLTRATNGFAQDTAVEPCAAYGYFLGSGIPTGTQTVAINETGGSPKIAWAVTLTAASDTAIEDSGVTQGDQANPAVALSTGAGVETWVGAVLATGIGFSANVDPGASYTLVEFHDFGANGAALERITTNNAGGGVTADFVASSDDVAMVALAIKETALPSTFTPRTVVF